ncbi:DUF4236 domain-containing protein [Sporolactobacillus putidus]|uniref:DUF4236 domain-containing protein n=1 Tax=Sporolactobacillus putidus TaxID=492735 RepID=A0A917W2K0_9BACL|nr:DUF4236 domain-containing protein [Sporolactobacillus putidus]GGL55641.1 hypothetical protein GCM10007968_19720 [Sporolactobacillus putidus]
MGWRYRRSVKIFPGLTLNFGKKSHSWTVGGKAARTTINPVTKKVTQSYSTPVKGLYWSKQYSTKPKEGQVHDAAAFNQQNKSSIVAVFELIGALISLGWQLLKVGIVLFILIWIVRVLFF